LWEKEIDSRRFFNFCARYNLENKETSTMVRITTKGEITTVNA
jgi:hypothetical protein